MTELLAGITVFELGTSIAAPYATMILAQMGAEVIKVENPQGGDASRSWGPPTEDGVSTTFETFNRDKKSITVDLSNPSEVDHLRQLIVDQADICLQNLRPGVVEKLGLGADTLREQNPSLVYCNIGAYGTEGPMSQLPGYDPLMQAFTGICHVTGPAQGEPCRVGVPVVDIGTGMWSVIGILASLMQRQQTGEGGVVDVALYETAMAWMTGAMGGVAKTGKVPGRFGTRGPGGLAPNRGYEAADGTIMITAGTNYHFGKLCRALGHEEWVEDERFKTAMSRHKNEVEMSGLIGAVVATQSRAYWMDKLNEVNVPNAPIQNPVEAFEHAQAKVSGILQPAEDGAGVQVALPIKFNRKRLPYRHRAPELGQHNEVVGLKQDKNQP
ncbi:MAG: CoA transferase [Pseudomonadales bacterium]|nr:CoA transferase [Pseudomonadales bacterium]